MPESTLDAAQVGKMFVTSISFKFNNATTVWDGNKSSLSPAHWCITATLSEKPDQYSGSQSMSIRVEQGIGQKLAEVLLPVIVADASRKAQQLADDSKAMLASLGDRTIACLAAPVQ